MWLSNFFNKRMKNEIIIEPEKCNTKRVICIAGLPATGKSTFIRENYIDKDIIIEQMHLLDLKDVQLELFGIKKLNKEEIISSYSVFYDNLQKKLKTYNLLVVEHPFVNVESRIVFCNKVRSFCDNCSIEIKYLITDKKTLRNNSKNRHIQFENEYVDKVYQYRILPSKEEGFDSVEIINLPTTNFKFQKSYIQ